MITKSKLSTKLMGGFLVMGVLLLMGGFVGSSGISRMSENLRKFSEIRLPEPRRSLLCVKPNKLSPL